MTHSKTADFLCQRSFFVKISVVENQLKNISTTSTTSTTEYKKYRNIGKNIGSRKSYKIAFSTTNT